VPSRRHLRLLAAVAVVLPCAGHTDELGQITAFMDGDQRTWHVITFEQSGRDFATATFRQSGHLAELQMQGHPVPEFTSKEVLSIDARFKGLYTPEAEPMSVDILYTPNGLSGPFWTSRGTQEQPDFEILSFDIWGDVGTLSALFSGQICKRQRLFSQTDTTDCIRVNGLVETRVEMR